MKHILEFFKEIIPIIFVVGILAIAFLAFNHVKNLAMSGLEKTYAYDEMLTQSDVLIYDGMTISGTDVRNFARTFYKDAGSSGFFEITVSNINGGKAIASVNGLSDLKPSQKFLCSVITEEGSVKGVAFTKK